MADERRGTRDEGRVDDGTLGVPRVWELWRGEVRYVMWIFAHPPFCLFLRPPLWVF